MFFRLTSFIMHIRLSDMTFFSLWNEVSLIHYSLSMALSTNCSLQVQMGSHLDIQDKPLIIFLARNIDDHHWLLMQIALLDRTNGVLRSPLRDPFFATFTYVVITPLKNLLIEFTFVKEFVKKWCKRVHFHVIIFTPLIKIIFICKWFDFFTHHKSAKLVSLLIPLNRSGIQFLLT